MHEDYAALVLIGALVDDHLANAIALVDRARPTSEENDTQAIEDNARQIDPGYDNLTEILRMVQASGAQALLVGMQIPPNYGPQYATAFRSIYAELAQQFAVPLVPFLLAGVAERPERMQADGIHPRVEAQPLVLDNVWPYLAPILTQP